MRFRLSPRMADRERWGQHAGHLVAMIEGVAKEMNADLRVAVVAFGDRPVPG